LDRIRWLAVVLRRLDQLLTEWDYQQSPEAFDPARWQPTGYHGYVIPVERSYRCEDGRDAERRATRFHAVVPTHNPGFSVRLILHPELTAGFDRDWIYGAAIFQDFVISVDEIEPDEFLVVQRDSPAAFQFVESQVSAALDAGTDVLMWPELTVDPPLRKFIEAKLSANPLRDSRRIPLVVPGSWHEKDDDDRQVNRALLLGPRGTTLAEVDKRRKFEFGNRFEAIQPGEVIPIVVFSDRLVALAICLDFCDDADSLVYARLGVDTVLVPAMGLERSADAQERHAKPSQTLQNTTVFVAQQVPALSGSAHPEGEPPGYSFALPPACATTPPAQTGPFRSLRAREKATRGLPKRNGPVTDATVKRI
jgi:predicted amidohydrolase